MNNIFLSKKTLKKEIQDKEKENQKLNEEIKKLRHDLNNKTMAIQGFNELFEDSEKKEIEIEKLKKQLKEKNDYIISKKEMIANTLESFIELNSHFDIISRFFEEVSSSMEESSAAVTQTSNNIEKVKQNQAMLETVSFTGGNNIISLQESINKIQSQSGNINEIVKIIMDVNSRIDLLSMNAAIESAHAGNAGKGFAIVAQEIRKLSEETAQNIKNIKINSKQIIESIEICSEKSNKTKQQFQKISDKINDTSSAIVEIASASREQSASIHQITNNMIGEEGIIETFKGITQIMWMMNECFSTLFDDIKK